MNVWIENTDTEVRCDQKTCSCAQHSRDARVPSHQPCSEGWTGVGLCRVLSQRSKPFRSLKRFIGESEWGLTSPRCLNPWHWVATSNLVCRDLTEYLSMVTACCYLATFSLSSAVQLYNGYTTSGSCYVWSSLISVWMRGDAGEQLWKADTGRTALPFHW